MADLELASELRRITSLGALDFEKALLPLHELASVVPLLAQLLSSTLPHHQKQMAAAGINRVFILRISQDPKQWPQLWQIFKREVLLSGEIEKAEWRHVRILVRAMQAFMDEFDRDFCVIVNPLFEKLELKARALVYEAFLEVETTNETRYIVLRETVDAYLKDIYNYVCWMHDGDQISSDARALEQALLSNLLKLLGNLSKYPKQLGEDFVRKILQTLSLNMDFFLLIVEELLFDSGKQGFQSLEKREFSVERMEELVLVSEDQGEHINAAKGHAIRCFSLLLDQFNKRSLEEEFDQYQHLNLMEQLAPIVLGKLAQLVTGGQVGPDNESVVTALIDWLSTASKFIFLMRFFENSLATFFFEVCYPLLSLDQEERAEYEASGEVFIRISEEMVETSTETSDYPRTAASRLLQSVTAAVNGALTFVAETCVHVIRHQLGLEPAGPLEQLSKKHGVKWSAESALTILTIFSDQYKGRTDLMEAIKSKVLDVPELEKLEGVALAKLLIFLAYNYELFYKGREGEAAPFLFRASQFLDPPSSLSSCALLLLNNCIGLGFGGDIWGLLLEKIVSGESVDLLAVMKQIVRKKMDSLPAVCVGDLIGKVTGRLIVEYQVCEGQAKGGNVKGSRALYRCLHILQEISQNREYLSKQQTLIAALWPVFDLFAFADKIEFEDNLLAIFGNVLAASSQLSCSSFAFVDKLPLIHEKSGELSPDMLRVFTFLLMRGREHFVYEHCLDDLTHTLNCLKLCYNILKREETLKQICILHQWAYGEYGSLLKKDKELFEAVFQIYQQAKDRLSEETIAAIINLFITQEVYYGHSHFNIIRENTICIFRDYQAQVAALGLRKLIQKYYKEDEVIDYLRYSIRLLHFKRTVETSKDSKARKAYCTPEFEGIADIDPFNETGLALDFLKRHIEARRYDILLESLSQEISVGEIKDLLSRRIVDQSIRTVYKVRNV